MGKVDKALLNHYKDLYDGHNIIYVRFLDNEFIFRTLNKKEYKYIYNAGLSQFDMEDTICNVTCLYPEEYDFTICGFAGLNEYVTSLILHYSYLDAPLAPVDAYKKYKSQTNLELQCMNLIKAFIPEYTYEEMEEWTWDKLMKITARAEEVSKLKGFDWHLKDNSEEVEKEYNDISIDNKEFVDKLIKDGIDPMFYFADSLQNNTIDLIDLPFIIGPNWQDKELIDNYRRSIHGT